MTSRRTFIAGAAVAPLVPLPAAAEADPAVAAFRRWVEAARARQTFIPPNEQDWRRTRTRWTSTRPRPRRSGPALRRLPRLPRASPERFT